MKKDSEKKPKLREKLPISESAYHNLVSILIGIVAGLVILAFVAFFTRDTRPTQYMLTILKGKLGIERDINY